MADEAATTQDTPTATTEGADEGIDLENLNDAKIDHLDTFATLLAAHVAAAKQAGSDFKRAGKAARKLAAFRCLTRARFILDKSGIPDWAADSDPYKQVVVAAESKALASLDNDAKSRLNATTRQHVKRNTLLPTVIWYCLGHYDPAQGEKYAPLAERWGMDSFNPAELTDSQREIMGNPPQYLVTDVRRHYRIAGLDIPEASAFAYEVNTTPTPPEEEKSPVNPIESLADAVGGLENIIPAMGIKQVLRALSIVAERIMGSGEMEGRVEVEKDLLRISTLANLAAKVTAQKADEGDVERLKGLLYNPKADAAAMIDAMVPATEEVTA